MKLLSRIALPLSLAFLASHAISQQSAPPNSDSVIRITVDLVQVDAVVTDSQGRHVADLNASDFELLEDGKPQTITHLSYVRGAGGSATPGMNPSPGKKDVYAVAEDQNLTAAQQLSRDQVQRTIVMIADDLGLSADDIPNVRKAMKSFIDREMQTGDLISIMTTSGGTGALEQLTNNRQQLDAAIERIRYLPGRTGETWYAPVHKLDVTTEIEDQSNDRLNAIRRPFLGSGTTGALTYAIQGLREMPGRKAIAFFSDGLPQSAGGIIEQANRASVVIYTLDPRGLASFFLTAVDYCKPPLCSPHAEETKRQAFYRGSQRTLEELARGTGGTFFHDNNDLPAGLNAALDDMSGYYLIGYQPQRTDFERVHGIARFHKIEVRVRRAGLHVRSRNGFVGTPDATAAADTSAPKSAASELQRALFSPFRLNDIPLRLSAFHGASTKKDPKTNKYRTTLRAMLALDARSLRFGDAPDGKKQLDIEVVAAAYSVNNEAIATSNRTFSATMTGDEMKQIVHSGLVYGIDIEIPKPGPCQLRVAVWDANARQTGSANVFLEVPDFNRPEIALSSITLHDSDTARNEELTRAGVMGAGSAVTRVFAPGAVLKYDSTVFGALIDSRTGKPRVDIEIRLFRGPERIFTGPEIPLLISDSNIAGVVRAAGEIRLPATLPPGDYAVELSAYDRLQKKQLQRTAQWADFTLVRP